MLASLVLTVRTEHEAVVPRNLGWASHALFLRLLAERDAGLAGELHDGMAPRPFTCSSLVGGAPQGPMLRLAPGAQAWLRFTGLTAPVSRHLLAIAANPPAQVELDGQVLQVCAATVDAQAHPWAASDGYRELCERILHAPGPVPRRVRLEFASPTTFHTRNAAGQRVNIPLPLPHLVFGSLLDRWQAFSPVAVDPDLRQYAQEMVVLSRCSVRTRTLAFKEGGSETGFVGEAVFSTLNADRYWGRVLQVLAAYALYAGVGAKTTMGMGQAMRMLEPCAGTDQ